ncbi:MAG TPA: hypothetical protein VFM69_00590 [Pricia sp.]|nr:hypothetical protein [Pricia sp.]
MSKSYMLYTLLGLWLFAIGAPSVITLIDADHPVVVSNLIEEEQHEQGKKGLDENKVLQYDTANFSLMSKIGNRTHFAFYLDKSLDTTLEIILPPPEHS